MNTYCICCETVRAPAAARAAEIVLGCRAIYPKQIQHTRVHGQRRDIVHDLLPGYVFLYFDEDEIDLGQCKLLSGFIRCLSDHHGHYRLEGNDERFALMLLENGGVLGKTRVYEEGQLIRICEGAYKGVAARILKVDRRNERIQIDLTFANRSLKTWVEYEIVQSDETGG